MAREFQRGHKAKISDLTAGTDLYVGVQIAAPGLTFDISCFGLDANEQLSDDRYFIFFNQPKSPEESIQLLGAQSGDTESFRVTLDRIPAAIQKLSFTATIRMYPGPIWDICPAPSSVAVKESFWMAAG
ncbi:TerD family protein, partial [Streptomyces sp. MBT54]|uniref:TerD family protein n=1 Tax=Streptomyces sp. MBT54 TaxID=1488385 RepID=UPI001F18182C